jgi:hypothetical protein
MDRFGVASCLGRRQEIYTLTGKERKQVQKRSGGVRRALLNAF